MFMTYFIQQILNNIINTAVYFGGYLYIMNLINAQQMNTLQYANMVYMCPVYVTLLQFIPWTNTSDVFRTAE